MGENGTKQTAKEPAEIPDAKRLPLLKLNATDRVNKENATVGDLLCY